MDPLAEIERRSRRRRQRRRLRRQRRLALVFGLLGLSAAPLALALPGGQAQGEPTRVTRVVPVRYGDDVRERPVSATSPGQKAKRPRRSAAKPCPLPSALRPHFEAASAKTGLPLSLLAAVAYVESRFDAEAVSEAGAQGLMQLMPATADILGVDPRVPRENVLGGARYLNDMLHAFADLELALAAYNAGPTAVREAGGAPSGETLRYVADVSALYRRHSGCV